LEKEKKAHTKKKKGKSRPFLKITYRLGKKGKGKGGKTRK